MSAIDYLDLCRLCLVKDQVSVSIFEDEGANQQIFHKIATCLPVKVNRDDRLPQKLCNECVCKVEMFYQYWNTTANAEKQLLQWLNDAGDDKQTYVLDSNVVKSNQSEDEANDQTNNISINVIQLEDMPIMISGEEQMPSVSMTSSTNVQPVAGTSSQAQIIRKGNTNHEVEEGSTEDDNTEDDECDVDEGLKEEIEVPNAQPSYVTIPCDAPGPSGLQQQKMEIEMQQDDDPKSGCNKNSKLMSNDDRGLFFVDEESVVMKKWQILEFDGKPYYAYVPVNEEPVDVDSIPTLNDDNNQELLLVKKKLVYNCKKESVKTSASASSSSSSPPTPPPPPTPTPPTPPPSQPQPSNNLYESEDDIMGNDTSFYDLKEKTNKKLLLLNGIDSQKNKTSQDKFYQFKINGSIAAIDKCKKEEKINTENDSQDSEDIIEYEKLEEDMVEDSSEELYESHDEKVAGDLEELYQSSANENTQDDGSGEQIQEVPEYIDGNELSSQVIEYITEEDEQDVDDVDIPDVVEVLKENKNTTGTKTTKSSGLLKCRVCSETFVSPAAFKKHVAWTHKKKLCIQEKGWYICSVCDYKTSKKSQFAAHLERKHETWAKKEQTLHTFPCGVCGFVCRSKHSLQSHFIRKHTDKYEHQCKFCPKKFKVKGDLTNHIRFHHKEKPVTCDVCGKSCQNSGSLYVHQKWAHYKPKFECPICKRRMVTQENLDQHMVTQHEKREKIVCAQCGKTFTKKDSFKRHMAVHTGSKPHACPICSKAFARQSQLRQHILIHTGKRNFTCDVCGKTFTQKPGLICHRKTHPGILPPLPVMPIADLVNEFTSEYLQENQREEQEDHEEVEELEELEEQND